MSYPETISWLFALQRFGIKLGLAKITALLKYLGNPQKRLRCIHVAGSNGKGSTAAFLQSILKQSGYQAGLYTSPHLIDFTERIRINDTQIKKVRVVRLTNEIKRICKKHSLENITFFEFVTAMAFKYFEEEGADPVIAEVGMGGRFDATNVITKPLISIITSISLEHQMYLGRRLSDIAREKAGIIKKGVPVISGVRQRRIKDFFRHKCRGSNAPFYQLGEDITCRKIKPGVFSYRGLGWELKKLQCGLTGDHQIRNASIAIAASELLKEKGYDIQTDSVITGIEGTIWPGRLEIIRKDPTIVLDGAHNPEAWMTLKKTLETNFRYKRLFFLIGVMDDKDICQMVNILTLSSYAIIVCRPKMERAAKKEHVQKFIRFSEQNRVFWFEESSEALEKALSMTSKNDLLCVTGSLFVVGEVREYLMHAGNESTGRIPL